MIKHVWHAYISFLIILEPFRTVFGWNFNQNSIKIRAQLFSDDGKKVFNVAKSGKINQPEHLGKVTGEEILQMSGNNFIKKRWI